MDPNELDNDLVDRLAGIIADPTDPEPGPERRIPIEEFSAALYLFFLGNLTAGDIINMFSLKGTTTTVGTQVYQVNQLVQAINGAGNVRAKRELVEEFRAIFVLVSAGTDVNPYITGTDPDGSPIINKALIASQLGI